MKLNWMFRIKGNVWALLAVSAIAFILGRLTVTDSSRVFAAQDNSITQEESEMEMTPEDLAMMEAGTPGKHHEYLNGLIGDWDCVVHFKMSPDDEPVEVPGKVSREWVLDGRFIRETVTADTDFGPFEGLGYLGYNNFDGQYEFIWMESHSTAIMSETGTFDPSRKILTSRGTHRDPASGQLRTGWGEFDLSNPNRHVYKGFEVGPDGKPFENFGGVFERVE